MSSYESLKRLLRQLPLSEEQQNEAADLVRKCTSEELSSLGLAPPARPVVPKAKTLEKLPMAQRLGAIQKVIGSIQYNHSPGYMYNVSKDRPFGRLMDTAREVLREALPIKCIEAVFLGTLLTAGWEGLHRMPLGFKSTANGETYRHVVLVVHHVSSQRWGALGISRREELAYKELVFDSLSDLLADYKAGYEKWSHKLTKARVGLPFHHDVYSNDPVCWRCCSISPTKQTWESCAAALEKFAGSYKSLYAKFSILGYWSETRAAPQPRPLNGEGEGEPAASTRNKASTSSSSPGKESSRHASPIKRLPSLQENALSARGSPRGKATRLVSGGHDGGSEGKPPLCPRPPLRSDSSSNGPSVHETTVGEVSDADGSKPGPLGHYDEALSDGMMCHTRGEILEGSSDGASAAAAAAAGRLKDELLEIRDPESDCSDESCDKCYDFY